jgi:phosphocarrier protein HPr
MAAVEMVTVEVLRRSVLIVNQRGLHARASARFVKCACTFDAQVTVSRNGNSAGGTSIMGLLALGASCGTEIEIAVQGPDAHKALDTLVDLVESGFGET